LFFKNLESIDYSFFNGLVMSCLYRRGQVSVKMDKG
jgi:hypothetical protein